MIPTTFFLIDSRFSHPAARHPPQLSRDIMEFNENHIEWWKDINDTIFEAESSNIGLVLNDQDAHEILAELEETALGRQSYWEQQNAGQMDYGYNDTTPSYESMPGFPSMQVPWGELPDNMVVESNTSYAGPSEHDQDLKEEDDVSVHSSSSELEGSATPEPGLNSVVEDDASTHISLVKIEGSATPGLGLNSAVEDDASAHISLVRIEGSATPQPALNSSEASAQGAPLASGVSATPQPRYDPKSERTYCFVGQCRFNFKSYMNRYFLVEHQEKEHKGSLFCAQRACSDRRDFVNIRNLEQHERVAHNSDTLYQCCYCRTIILQSDVYKSTIRTHIRQMHTMANMQRAYDKILENFKLKRERLGKHQPLYCTQWQCPNKTDFVTASKLEHHELLAHRADLRYRCYVCRSLITTRKGIRRHARDLHPMSDEDQMVYAIIAEYDGRHTLPEPPRSHDLPEESNKTVGLDATDSGSSRTIKEEPQEREDSDIGVYSVPVAPASSQSTQMDVDGAIEEHPAVNVIERGALYCTQIGCLDKTNFTTLYNLEQHEIVAHAANERYQCPSCRELMVQSDVGEHIMETHAKDFVLNMYNQIDSDYKRRRGMILEPSI